MLLIHFDQDDWSRIGVEARQKVYGELVQVADELTAAGQYLGGHPLQPPAQTTCVRVRDGKRLVTDGPFAETHEQLGGYMLVDVRDRDEAIGIAARIAAARTGTVEVREVREGPPS
jgi:hypothetical protein